MKTQNDMAKVQIKSEKLPTFWEKNQLWSNLLLFSTMLTFQE